MFMTMTDSATATIDAPTTGESTIMTSDAAPEGDSKASAAPVADSKPAPAEAVPTYNIEAPEGYDKDGFIKFATEHKLDPKVAQNLIEREVTSINATFEKAAAEHKAEVAKWKQQLETDKEFGGDAFKGNSALVATFVKKFASPDVVKLFNDTGLGNHPALVKMFHKMAQATSSDKMVGKDSPPPAAKEASLAERLYPDMYKK
jgi:hypothetical protein